jgi:hypothetical protein
VIESPTRIVGLEPATGTVGTSAPELDAVDPRATGWRPTQTLFRGSRGARVRCSTGPAGAPEVWRQPCTSCRARMSTSRAVKLAQIPFRNARTVDQAHWRYAGECPRREPSCSCGTPLVKGTTALLRSCGCRPGGRVPLAPSGRRGGLASRGRPCRQRSFRYRRNQDQHLR